MKLIRIVLLIICVFLPGLMWADSVPIGSLYFTYPFDPGVQGFIVTNNTDPANLAGLKTPTLTVNYADGSQSIRTSLQLPDLTQQVPDLIIDWHGSPIVSAILTGTLDSNFTLGGSLYSGYTYFSATMNPGDITYGDANGPISQTDIASGVVPAFGYGEVEIDAHSGSSPVPEPSTALLVGPGLALFFLTRCRAMKSWLVK